jgi:hypothetical protein
MDINAILSVLADGKSALVAHPAAIERLIELGASIQRSPQLAPQEAVERLFDKRKKLALELVPSLPGIPGSLPASVVALYEEIIQALLFGLHGAAITQCGILVEFAMKFSVFIVETGSATAEAFDAEKWDQLENVTMGGAITRALKAGIISLAHEAQLIDFKDTVRNPYSHYNIQRICKPWRWENVRKVDLITGEVSVANEVVADDPVLQAQAKPEIDRRESLRVLAFADRVVQHVFATAWQKLGDVGAPGGW